MNEPFGKSFEQYSAAVKNKIVTTCTDCGSENSTNHDYLNKPSCYNCGYTMWEGKFPYKTVGVFS